MEFSTDTLNRALELARKGEGHTRPNPPVGAMIFDREGRCIGEGYHHRAGTGHAETEAIKDWRRRHPDKEAAALLVTLEPCSKPGRVGACTEAIIAAKIPQVAYMCTDPNPTNRNRAKRVLAKAGISCEHVKCKEAEDLIRPFAKRMLTGMPYVTVKLAMTLDGKTTKVWHALRGGETADAPGTMRAAKRGIECACGDGRSVLVTEVQSEGGKRMASAAWLNGKRVAPGTVLA